MPVQIQLKPVKTVEIELSRKSAVPAAANLGAIRPLPIPRVGAPHLKVLDTCGSAAHDIKAHTLWKVGSKEKQRRVERFDKVCVRIRTESRTELPSPLLHGGALAEARLPVLACNRHLHGGVGLQGMRQFAHAHLHVRHKLVEQTLMRKPMLALHATLSLTKAEDALHVAGATGAPGAPRG